MSFDPLKPAADIPPRTLYEWTTVEGHNVTNVEVGKARCSCGETQRVQDLVRQRRIGEQNQAPTVAEAAELRADARAWRAEHLRTAWPVLVRRIEGEAVEDHAQRVADELSAARRLRDKIADELDASGDAIPVATEALMDAGQRAAVLKHQYNEISERLHREHQARGSEDALKWLVEGAGDPLDEL